MVWISQFLIKLKMKKKVLRVLEINLLYYYLPLEIIQNVFYHNQRFLSSL
jgi:hypothetical protein